MRFIELFKPLFSYKKYITAHLILKRCCSNYIEISNSDNEGKYLSAKQYPKIMLASNFLNTNKINDTGRLLEAVDLLKSNGNIIVNENSNLYKYSIQATIYGEYAINDGYYQKIIYKRIALIISTPIIGAIITYLAKLIP